MTADAPRPPRLLAVAPGSLVSGAEVVLLRVLAECVERGWQVACASPPGPMSARIQDEGATWVRLPELKLPKGPRALGAGVLAARSAVAAVALRRAARDADVVLVNGILALPAVRAAGLAGSAAPVVWLVHDVVRRRDWELVLRVGAPAIHTAVAVSDAAAAPVGRRGTAVQVIRNGTPWPVEPAEEPPAEAPPVVGCASMLTSWKGQDVLLEAVARLPRDDVVVELAGGSFPKDGPYVQALHDRAARPDLAGRVRFLGALSDAPARMRTWTVGAIPSVDPEAAPLVLLEYMRLGLPIVATDHGGTPEVIGDAGLLVPPRDAGALAEALARMIDDASLRERCRQAGRAAIAAGLTIEEQRAALADLLAEVAAGR